MTFDPDATLDEFETETGIKFVAQPAPEKGDTCAGCAFDGLTTVEGTECCGTPECSPNSRTDARDIIWVLAEPGPKAEPKPKAKSLTKAEVIRVGKEIGLIEWASADGEWFTFSDTERASKLLIDLISAFVVPPKEQP